MEEEEADNELLHFYPRPPRGGRPNHIAVLFERFRISIHALREEGDQNVYGESSKNVKISIHALREEGDLSTFWSRKNSFHFYPRPPRGGRLFA